MTALSPPPAPHNSRSTRLSPARIASPPVAFQSTPIRKSRADSPSPRNLHPRASLSPARKDGSSSDEEIPPSISQRRVPARTKAADKGRLRLPAESSQALKEKRSFERTKQWAEEAEAVRRAKMADDKYEDEGSLEGLVSDRSIDGSTASPIPPRTPSPISLSRPPQLSLTLPSEKPAPILSIDDIIRQHAAAADVPMLAARARARRELGMAPSPAPSAPSSPLPGDSKPSTPRPPGWSRTSKPGPPPEIPMRTSSSPTARVHVIPSRSSSIASPGLGSFPSSSLHTPASVGSGDHPSIYPTPPSTLPRQSHPSLAPTFPNQSHTTLPVSQPTSPGPEGSPRPPTFRASTAPSPAASEGHERALHLRSPQLNKFLTFPRPFPERPLRVSYAEVGRPDGLPVLVFLGVGCVRYLMALYDQLALVYGLRLICVDRWGYGKTGQVDQVDRGLIEWSGVISQVIDKLGIRKFQVVAHSAGVPYAMAVARRFPEKIRGRIHLLAPWVGQDHDTVLSKWLKWVPGGVIRTATAADHRIQTYFLGKAPRLQYAPISFDARVTPLLTTSTSAGSEPPAEELEDLSKSTNLMRRASTVFSSGSKPRSRSIYGTAASATTINLSLPNSLGVSTPASLRRAGSTRSPTPSPDKTDTLSLLGRSPGLKNIAAMRSAKLVSTTPSSESRGTASTAPSSDLLATPDQSELAISASELDFGLGEGFGSFATDLGLAMPVLKAMAGLDESLRLDSGSPAMSRSTSGTSERPSESTTPIITPIPVEPSSPFLLASRFPSDPAFCTAITQASHAECEPGTTSDILRVVLNKPHRPWGFRYEDVEARSHVWIGNEDRIISKESIQFMEEVCGATVDRRAGEGHNLMSSSTVLVDLFKCLGEEARGGKRKEEEEERDRVEKVEKEREDQWRAGRAQRSGRRW